MDKLFYNGIVRTLDDEDRVFEAIGVKDGEICYLGGSGDSVLHADEKINLDGKLLIPGFCDTHMHLLNYVTCKRQLSFWGVNDIPGFLERIREYISINNERIREAGYLSGRGFNQESLAEKRYPSLAELDSVCPDMPMILTRVCGHVALCNSKGLEAVKKAKGFSGLADCVDLKTGLLSENAIGLFFESAGQDNDPSASEIKAMLLEGISDLNALGICSVGTNDYFGNDGLISALTELEADGLLNAAVSLQWTCETPEEVSGFIRKGFHRIKGRYFSAGPLKLFADGSLGARTAALNDGYSDEPGNRGILIYGPGKLEELVGIAHGLGIQVAIHGIGDRAMDVILDAFEKAQGSGENTLRHGIVHAQITNAEILERMKKLGTCAYVQPVFFEDDIGVIRQRVGEKRAAESYSYKTMLGYGIPVSGGSDAPVCGFNPLENIWYAVARTRMDGEPAGGFLPEESLPIGEAVRLFTKYAAWFCFEENLRGTLEKGKCADFTVLDKDIFTVPIGEIKNTAVCMTVSGGRIVYQA